MTNFASHKRQSSMYRNFMSWPLLQDSDIDPIICSTGLRLLRVYRYHSKRQFECIDLTLSVNSAGKDILPVSCFPCPTVGVTGATNLFKRLLTVSREFRVIGPVLDGARIHRFSIDATGKRAVGVARPSVSFWPGTKLSSWGWQNDLTRPVVDLRRIEYACPLLVWKSRFVLSQSYVCDQSGRTLANI